MAKVPWVSMTLEEMPRRSARARHKSGSDIKKKEAIRAKWKKEQKEKKYSEKYKSRKNNRYNDLKQLDHKAAASYKLYRSAACEGLKSAFFTDIDIIDCICSLQHFCASFAICSNCPPPFPTVVFFSR